MESRNAKNRRQLWIVRSEALIQNSSEISSLKAENYKKINSFNYIISWIAKSFKKKSEAQIYPSNVTNQEFSKISVPNPILFENEGSSIINSEKHDKKVLLSMKSDKITNSHRLNVNQLLEPQSLNKVPLKQYVTLEKPILNKIELNNRKNTKKDIELTPNFKKVFSQKDEKPEVYNLSNLSSVDETETIFFKRIPENDNTLPKPAGTDLLEEELLPVKRPEIIASIKVLLEPTISSGAVTYSDSPISRPEMVSNQNQIDESDVSLSARATRGPSFPKRASVISNATMNDILELNRTNLIGIFGTEFNAAALVRLSSGQVIKVKVGDQFQGWRVFAIDRDKIHLANGNKQETLRLPG